MILVLLNHNLRLTDNKVLQLALHHSNLTQKPIALAYLLGEFASNIPEMSCLYIKHSLKLLNSKLNNKISFINDIKSFCLQNSISEIFYTSLNIDHIEGIKQHNIEEDFRLFDYTEIKNESGQAFRVFSPFYKKAIKTQIPQQPTNEIDISELMKVCINSKSQTELFFNNIWENKMQIEAGEEFAKKKLEDFIRNGIKNYKELRNRPDLKHTSQLSQNINTGEISLRYVWHRVFDLFSDPDYKEYKKDIDHFLSELGWREFSYYLCYHNPEITTNNFNSKWDVFPWKKTPFDENTKYYFDCWRFGYTGYPIIDAAMRCLWQTGVIHNRLRMIVASFLVKDLLIDWRVGEKWFWHTLIDADKVVNAVSWQWVAGSGADAAPYFRIFNPILQSKKFDPDANFILKFVPELKNLPKTAIHTPWEVDEEMLSRYGIKLGIDYPRPILDHSIAKENALKAYSFL